MTSPLTERPRGRRLRFLAAIFTVSLMAAGVSAVVLTPNTASAAPIPVSQCNGVFNTGGLSVICTVTIVNTLTDSPTTTGSVITMTDHTGATTVQTSTDIVISVNQCNSSARGSGGTLQCYVTIINNIAMNGAATAGTATISQCNGNQPDGLGSTAPLDHSCSPVANTGTGATIFQCNNRTGNGGGLVNAPPNFSHCTASGSVSSSLPITVNQCNEDSADGGGGQVDCRTTITTNVVDTALTGGTTGGGTTGSGTSGGAPRPTPVPGIPNLTG